MSKTERALSSEEADALDDGSVDDDVPVALDDDEPGGGDSTAEIWAQVDEALDEYAAESETAESADADVDADAAVSDAAESETAESESAESVDADVDVDDDIETAPDADGSDAEVSRAELFDEADLEDLDAAEAAAADLPEIIPATSDVDESGERDAEARELDDADDDAVSDEILEELRRADIDGPIVDAAPQDDTTAARRRPKRLPDYDPAPRPIPAQIPRVLGRKPRVRKVTRVVRHVDPWSVFKIAIVAHLVLYVIVLTAGVLLWNVAHATGTVDNVERFFESFGWDSFEFNGGEIYHAAWIAGLFAVIGLTGLAVLTATLFNLITDLVGGMRFTVLEEEVVETRTSPMRRFVIRRPEPIAPVRLEDASGSMIREAVVDDSGAIDRPPR